MGIYFNPNNGSFRQAVRRTVRVGIDGTVVIPYATQVAGVDGGRLKLCYDGNPGMTLPQTNNGKAIWERLLP